MAREPISARCWRWVIIRLNTILASPPGLVLGGGVGVGLGLLVSMSTIARRLVATPLHILRMCPLLAMIPLFQFWLGASNGSAICYVAYGVGVVYFVGTLNAIANLPRRYIEAAQTLGARDGSCTGASSCRQSCRSCSQASSSPSASRGRR